MLSMLWRDSPLRRLAPGSVFDDIRSDLLLHRYPDLVIYLVCDGYPDNHRVVDLDVFEARSFLRLLLLLYGRRAWVPEYVVSHWA